MPKRRYSQSEWARLQSRLPEEDRVPYSESPMVPTLDELEAQLKQQPTREQVMSKADERVAQARKDKEIAAQAQIDAARNAAIIAVQTGATLDLKTGLLTAPKTTPVIPPIVLPVIPPIIPPVIPPVMPPTTDPALLALLEQLRAQNTALTAAQQQAQINAAAQAEADRKRERESALAVLTDRFTRYGLASLVPKIRDLVIGGATESTITLQLQETEEYRQRFAANQERIKKNLAVLSPGEYLGLEDRYRQILRAYGLRQFDNDNYVQQFLANDVSPEELSSRVVTAVQRVQNADPAVSKTLRDFYGIGATDMVAYVLDPSQQFPKIERQVAAAEIGTAARRQGLEAGVNVAEQLAAQGITQAEAQRGYATIADILPGATKLSEIYTDVLDQYGQAEAEQEVFNSLASAQRKRRALTEREVAAFRGSSGLGRTSLSTQTGGTF